MTDNVRSIPSSPPHLVLSQDEAARRLLLLADLQTCLANLGVRCVLARNHRLVLRWHSSGSFGPSGLTDPQLHIFTPAGAAVATTDGSTFCLATGQRYHADDPVAAAADILDCAALAAPACSRPLAPERRI